jgi:diaminopimelate decarboxylase
VRPHQALPLTATAGSDGVLHLGGCAVHALAARYGTPLYIYDLVTLRRAMQAARTGLNGHGTVHYAAKAYLAPWLLHLLQGEGLGLDAASESELRLALAAGMPAGRIRLHGNNKSDSLLRLALAAGIEAVVVDSLQELVRLSHLAAAHAARVRVLLRINPALAVHTHHYLQTATAASKFGIPIEGGQAAEAVRLALAATGHLHLLGYHAHLGTQILEEEPYRALIRTLLTFAEGVFATQGFWPEEISPGGGPGITYTDERPLPLDRWTRRLTTSVADLPLTRRPRLSVEPGRAIVGPAGVALYTIGTIKRTPAGHTLMSVDGGMADNIRPALYQARYAALAATRLHDPIIQRATIAGSYCESGDVLVHDTPVPALMPGDLLALPASGAYCLAMSSNYNGALRPAVVVVEHGVAALVQRRQTVEDLRAVDLPLPALL